MRGRVDKEKERMIIEYMRKMYQCWTVGKELNING
jgi:hypothetical protein